MGAAKERGARTWVLGGHMENPQGRRWGSTFCVKVGVLPYHTSHAGFSGL